MSMMTRRMKKKAEEAEMQESISSTKTINDVPIEVLEIILKKLDSGENSLLPYRLVHSGWKSIIDDYLEKRILTGDVVACSKAVVDGEVDWLNIVDPTIRVPLKLFHNAGNPFHSRSLLITQNCADPRNYGINPIITTVDDFTTKFGIHLNMFALDGLHLKFPTLIRTLKPLSNLKILKLSKIFVHLNSEDDLNSFPALPCLTTLELNTLIITAKQRSVDIFENVFLNLLNAYANQLVSLKLQHISNAILQKSHRPVENCSFQKLEHLKIFNPTKNFLELSCATPLKSLSIVTRFVSVKIYLSIDILMGFVDKSSETLESLVLDCPWNEIFSENCRENAVETGGVLQTAAVKFPKLTKLTISYPTNEGEEAVIKRTFLPKFPALRDLNLFHFKLAPNVNQDDYGNPAHTNIITEFLTRENYSGQLHTLARVSVWFKGEKTDLRSSDRDNIMVYSMTISRGSK